MLLRLSDPKSLVSSPHKAESALYLRVALKKKKITRYCYPSCLHLRLLSLLHDLLVPGRMCLVNPCKL